MAAGVLCALVIVTAHAGESRSVYVGDGRYTCVGNRDACRPFEAQERARQEERRYQSERLEQERRRDMERAAERSR